MLNAAKMQNSGRAAKPMSLVIYGTASKKLHQRV